MGNVNDGLRNYWHFVVRMGFFRKVLKTSKATGLILWLVGAFFLNHQIRYELISKITEECSNLVSEPSEPNKSFVKITIFCRNLIIFPSKINHGYIHTYCDRCSTAECNAYMLFLHKMLTIRILLFVAILYEYRTFLKTSNNLIN